MAHALQLAHARDYVPGNGVREGWGGKEYTAYCSEGVTFPGFYAYMVDEIYSESLVELSGRIFNYNPVDNLFRNGPLIVHPRPRNTLASVFFIAKGCTTTSVDTTYTIHGLVCVEDFFVFNVYS